MGERSMSAYSLVPSALSPSTTSPGRRLTRATSAHGWKEKQPQNEPQPQYEIRPDGGVVRMRCPKCGADKFRSMLGFLNHCRIHCRLVFTGHDDRLARCGVLVEEAEAVEYLRVAKHPTQLKQQMDLALIRADVVGPAVSDKIKKIKIRVGAGEDETIDGLPGIGSAEDFVGEGTGRTNNHFDGSRFYIRKRIIIGNEAKFLLSNKQKNDPEESMADAPNSARQTPTHKWRIYIKTPSKKLLGRPPEPDEEVTSFIKGVRFFLHPTYKPADVVEVTAPCEVSGDGRGGAYEVMRSGWGEFPVRIQLHFWDPRNRPVEMVHLLRVLNTTSNKYSVMAEQIHEIEINRNTDFSLAQQATLPVELPSLPLRATTEGVKDEDLLTMVIEDFPLTGTAGRRAVQVEYRPVSSMEEFLRLNLSLQKGHEQRRAQAVGSFLTSTYPTFAMDVDSIKEWCRRRGLVPASVASLLSALEQAASQGDSNGASLMFCRFCGLAHLPQDKFEVLQKNCSLRPRKIHLSSRTMAGTRMEKFEMIPETSETLKRLKQEYMGSTVYFPLPTTIRDGDSLGSAEIDGDNDDQLVSWTRDRVQELQLPTTPAFDEELTNQMMTSSLKSFLKDLLTSSIVEIPTSKEHTEDRPVMLTPLHLYRLVISTERFDFLSNAYMSGGPGKGST